MEGKTITASAWTIPRRRRSRGTRPKWADSLGMGGRHPSVWVGAIRRNGWARSIGTGGRIPSEWVGVINRYRWARSLGIAGRDRSEYSGYVLPPSSKASPLRLRPADSLSRTRTRRTGRTSQCHVHYPASVIQNLLKQMPLLIQADENIVDLDLDTLQSSGQTSVLSLSIFLLLRFVLRCHFSGTTQSALLSIVVMSGNLRLHAPVGFGEGLLGWVEVNARRLQAGMAHLLLNHRDR